MSVYSSRDHLARFSRSYCEDEGADYVVRSYDVSVIYNPSRRHLDGQTRLAIETTASSANTLKIRLADSLNVDSIVSPELGRLLSVRVRKQNTVVINLPTTVIKGYRLELVVTYSGPIEPQEIDREAVAVSAPQAQDQPTEEEELPLEESYLFSNRSYWYAQALTLGYAPARISVIVPEPWSAVASGEFESVAPPPGPAPRGPRLREFTFVARQPVRYLTFLVGRFTEPRIETISLKHLDETLLASRRPGVYYDEVELRVQTNPRQRARGKDVLRTTANILRFYTSLIGDFPVLGVDERGGRAAAAGRAQPAVPVARRHARTGIDAALGGRPGRAPQLPGLLRRPRTRPPVVGPGGRVEELPRALAERGVRAVLRSALGRTTRSGGACSTPSSGACSSGPWRSRTRARCISATGSATSRATAGCSAR